MKDDTDLDPTEGFQPIDVEAESVYEIIFREMEDAVFLIDVGQTGDDCMFTFRQNNASHRDLTGLVEDEMRGQTPRELLGDEQGASVAANYRRCVEQGETIQYEGTLELPAGTSYWQTKLTPITENGNITQIVGVARDITEKKNCSIENAVRERDHSVLASFLRLLRANERMISRNCRYQNCERRAEPCVRLTVE